MAMMKNVKFLKSVEIEGDLKVTGDGHAYVNGERVATLKDISTVYRYKGSVSTYAALPKGSTASVGDVYNVTDEDGMNYVWDGEKWDALGASIDLSNYLLKQDAVGVKTSGGGERFNHYSNEASGTNSHAEGRDTIASNEYAHAEGKSTVASARASHAEGDNTSAKGAHSHSEGSQTIAEGHSAHAEGMSTRAGGTTKPTENADTSEGYFSHSEGNGTWASGNSSHAEGVGTEAKGIASHAEGHKTTALRQGSHSEGISTIASEIGTHAEGTNSLAGGTSKPSENTVRTEGYFAHAEGNATWAKGNSAHAEGIGTEAQGIASHAEGLRTTAGEGAHSEGNSTTASGKYSHAEGNGVTSSGTHSHAEGNSTTASATSAHAEGNVTVASGIYSHAEGSNTQATHKVTHAEGNSTTASGEESHAEGYSSIASGKRSHAQGSATRAIGYAAHSEGIYTIAGTSTETIAPTPHTEQAEGYFSHAEGNGTWAYGNSSHAGGIGTIAAGRAQTAIGEYNKKDNHFDLFVVGNGNSNSDRNDAFAVGYDGTTKINGAVSLNGDMGDEDTFLTTDGTKTYWSGYRSGNGITFKPAETTKTYVSKIRTYYYFDGLDWVEEYKYQFNFVTYPTTPVIERIEERSPFSSVDPVESRIIELTDGVSVCSFYEGYDHVYGTYYELYRGSLPTNKALYYETKPDFPYHKTIEVSSEIINKINTNAENINDLSQRVTALETGVCLKKGTQITMADGTTKNIEDVQYGDIVLGYDIENNAYVNVKSYGSVRTGVANVWDIFTFEDGTSIEIYKNHHIYSKTNNHMKPSLEWSSGEYGVSQDLKEIQLAVIHKIGDPEFTERYSLFTENSTYFANGIVCGHHPWSRMKYYSAGDMKFNSNITEDEVELFRATAEVFNKNSRNVVNQRSYLKEAAPFYAKINIADKEIKKRKKILNSEDYKTIKHAQGKLSDAEFEATCTKCQAARDEIAVEELVIKTNTDKIAEIKSKYEILAKVPEKEMFLKAYAIDMAHVRNNGLN